MCRRSEWVVVEAPCRPGPSPESLATCNWLSGAGPGPPSCFVSQHSLPQPAAWGASPVTFCLRLSDRRPPLSHCLTHRGSAPNKSHCFSDSVIILQMTGQHLDAFWERGVCAGHLNLSLPVNCKIKWKSAKWPDSVRSQFLFDFSVNSRDIFVKRYISNKWLGLESNQMWKWLCI